jgi:serine/threonine protein kinase/tetratricopeptide (TPR) repeat protein
MGEVYRARDPRLKRDIAIKVLPETTAADPERRTRLKREAQSIAALNHPNIVTLFSAEEADGVLFLTMEYVEGRSLCDVIVKGGLPLTEIFKLAIPLVDAVAAAHQKGLTHRDLKPANVMITADGRLKVLDFGLAKLEKPSRADDLTTRLATATLTDEGRIVGTIAYMSPEQAEGKLVDQRTDIFSVGVILYEIACGERPFQGDSNISVLSSIIKDSPQSLASLRPNLPRDLSRIIHRCLVKDVDRRYQSAKDLRNELEDLKRDTDHRLQTSEGLGDVEHRPIESAPIPIPSTPARDRRIGWKGIATATTVVGVGVVAVFAYLSRPHAFSERDSVVIADFANTTGEKVFDDALKEALEVHLRQSPYINVLSDERIQGTLRLMSRAPGDTLTPEVARDLCQRTASKAMIAGSIAPLGKRYVISLNTTNCHTGDTIDKRQEEAASQDEVLQALGRAADQLRRRLGESLASIRQYDAPIQATTKSLDALKLYSLGVVKYERESNTAGIPFFRRAIEQDPDFARAHAALASALFNSGQIQPAIDEARKAYALKDRVSEPERLYIISRYSTIVENSVAKAMDTCRLWIQTYPNEVQPHISLGVLYQQQNEHAKAVEEFQTAIKLAPENAIPYVQLEVSYVALGKLDEARTTLETAIAHGLDSTDMRWQLYEIAALKHDDADMTRQLEAARGFPDSSRMLPPQVRIAMSLGRLAQARELTERYEAASTTQADLRVSPAAVWADVAEMSAVVGDKAAARTEVQRSLSLTRNTSTLFNGAWTLGLVGDAAKARKLLDDAKRLQSPEERANPEVERSFHRTAALIRVWSGDARAIDAWPPPGPHHEIFIGWANLLAGRPEIAATQLKELLDRRPTTIGAYVAVTALLYGRALAKLGRTDEARTAYEQFFDNWKVADATLPILIRAKLEYQKLPKP